jgi:hypothetical protein
LRGLSVLREGVFVIAAVLSAAVWISSPYLRERVTTAVKDVLIYETSNAITPVGLSLALIAKRRCSAMEPARSWKPRQSPRPSPPIRTIRFLWSPPAGFLSLPLAWQPRV